MPESFTAIYSAALKDLCASLDPKDLVLFIFLCAHANENGVCYPSVKTMGQQLDWRFEEVRYRLDRLERQSLLRYLRRASRNPYTGEFVNDLYQMNPKIYKAKSPVTHPSENAEPVQLRTPPSNLQHNQNQNQNQELESEPESGTTSNKPDEISPQGKKHVTGYAWEGGGYANPNSDPIPNTQNHTAPAGTKPVTTGQGESLKPPGSAPPPQVEPVPRLVNPLPDAALEALANEVRAMAPTRLYNARELVVKYGEDNIRKGLAQLAAAKDKGNIYNPYGLLTTWLRNGSIQTEPSEKRPTWADYASG